MCQPGTGSLVGSGTIEDQRLVFGQLVYPGIEFVRIFPCCSFDLKFTGIPILTLARIYNLRQGLTAADDRLALRSYGPTTSGALAEAGIDPEELEEAVHAYYGMMGWDAETGVPTLGKLRELDIEWAADYLPSGAGN